MKSEDSFRILVAEDDPANALYLERILSKFGHKVVMVHDGRAALEELARATFDVVLMDIHMPVMNGIEASRQIRSLHGDKAQVPIIALTANALSGDRERFLAEGMDDYISKPADFSTISKVIRNAVRSNRERGNA